MSITLWLIAIFIGVLLFTMGGILSWVLIHHEYDGVRNPQVILGALFAVLGLAVIINSIQLNLHFEDQVKCNSETVRILTLVTEKRRTVDEAATQFDTAVELWLDDPSEQREVDLRNSVAHVAQTRMDMIHAYLNNPYPIC